MPENDCFQVEIEEIAYGGAGLGRLDGLVHFVKGALPGEIVLAKRTSVKKNCVFARALKILRSSQSRIEPLCPFALVPGDGADSEKFCPACSYQHLDYRTEVEVKNRQLRGMLRRIGGQDADYFLLDPIPSAKDFAYRNKVSMRLRGTCLGYFAEDNTTLIDLPSCPLGMDEINEKIREFRSVHCLSRERASECDESVVFRWSDSHGAICLRDPGLPERIAISCAMGDFLISPQAFFQVNRFVLDKLIEIVAGIVSEFTPDIFYDPYCGCGIFGIVAAKAGAKCVIGADIAEESAGDAKINAEIHHVSQICEFRRTSAESLVKDACKKNGSRSSILFLDPPRSGLSRKMLGSVLEFPGRWILYMSCAPDTLARDLKTICRTHRPVRGLMADMFPRTSCFESLILLEKR